MNPEDDVNNPSSLTKFRKLRLKDTDLMNYPEAEPRAIKQKKHF